MAKNHRKVGRDTPRVASKVDTDSDFASIFRMSPHTVRLRTVRAERGGLFEKSHISFEGIVAGFPAFLPFSGNLSRQIEQDFKSAGMENVESSRYFSLSCSFSAMAALLAIPFLLFFFSLAEALGYSAVFFGVIVLLSFRVPSLLARRRAEAIEAELPFLLREAAVYSTIGVPFERIFETLAKGKYLLSQDFAKAGKALLAGSGIENELVSISSRYRSIPLKRSLFLMSSIYSTGGGSDSLKKMAEELSHAQLSRMRAQSSRLSLLAIIYISTSALIPAFFSSFLSFAPLISSQKAGPELVWAVFLIAFPFLNSVSLGISYILLPAVPMLKKEGGELFEAYLAKSGFPLGRRNFVFIIVAVSLSLSLAFFLFGMPFLALSSVCIAPAAYSLVLYLSESEIKKQEYLLPDALQSAAATHRLLSPEKMLSLLSQSGMGRLSEAFSIALRRQKAGESFSSSLLFAVSHFPSFLFERAVQLIIVAYETGADMYSALREAAQDMVSFFSLVSEHSALLSMQRYTMLASASVLVPLILGTVVSFMPFFSSVSLLALDSGDGGAGGVAFPSELVGACQAYLLINSALSSMFLGFSETDAKKAALYFAFIAPVSMIVFHFASSGLVFSALA